MPQTPETQQTPPDVSRILSRRTLGRLRAAYGKDPDYLLRTSREIILGMYRGASGMAAFLERDLYLIEEFARDREQIIITVLSLHGHGRGSFLALHLYWGLMVGLSPEELARQFLLIGCYHGIDTMTAGLRTLNVLLVGLERYADSHPSDDDLSPARILGEIQRWFAGQ